MNWLLVALGLLSGLLIGYWWGFFDGARVQRLIQRTEAYRKAFPRQ